MIDKKIFLSYSRSDSAFVLKIASELETLGASLWLDKLNIFPGSTWDSEIVKALEDCHCIIVVLSISSINSNQVLNEIDYGLNKGKKIIPLKIDECEIPLIIRRLQYIDLRENYEKGLSQLLKILDIEIKSDIKNEEHKNFDKVFDSEELLDWNNAERIDTIPSYNNYLLKYKNGKYEAEALNTIGDIYFRGSVSKGGKKDLEKSFEYRLRAAEAGSREGMLSVGFMYTSGMGRYVDYTKAMEWYLKSADLGNAMAMNNIGYLYKNGYGVPKDLSKAYVWEKKAKDAGYKSG